MVTVASPNLATPLNIDDNPIKMYLTVKFKHPCRDAVFTSQLIKDMNIEIDGTPSVQTVPPFIHCLGSSKYDCGLQALSIPEHEGIYLYPFSDILTGST